MNARKQFERKTALLPSGTASQQDADTTEAATGVAAAQVEVNQKALDLAVVGPRQEDIDQAEAQLRGNEAQLAYLRQQLADVDLKAPLDSVVRSRLMEPGEMASPLRGVLARHHRPEMGPHLRLRTGFGKDPHRHAGHCHGRQLPGRAFEGWIGFVSPIAEFTPKAVETEELRTSLLYEVRVFVKDPGNDLPLGMPATVHLPLNASDTDRTPTR